MKFACWPSTEWSRQVMVERKLECHFVTNTRDCDARGNLHTVRFFNQPPHLCFSLFLTLFLVATARPTSSFLRRKLRHAYCADRTALRCRLRTTSKRPARFRRRRQSCVPLARGAALDLPTPLPKPVLRGKLRASVPGTQRKRTRSRPP